MTEIRYAPLFSGSSGNSIYVGAKNTHILVDAGVSGARVCSELGKAGVEPTSLMGILVTHEHDDHIKGVGILSRKYNLPVYATAGTWAAMEAKIGDVAAKNRIEFDPEMDFYIGDLSVRAFNIPHDAAQPVGYCFDSGSVRFAVATDIGYVGEGWLKMVRGADAVLLESNYDPDMLKAGRYTYALKKRILSRKGHLPNDEAGEAAVQLVRDGARHIILGHLSKENNFPELALRSVQMQFHAAGMDPDRDVRLQVASRDMITGMFSINSGFI